MLNWLPIQNYDPAVPEYSKPPAPADLVVCTDVLEHVEPEMLDGVLDDLKRLTLHYFYGEIAIVPAKKTLADGRNAHLTVHPIGWWLPKLCERFDIWRMEQDSNNNGFIVAAKAKKGG